MNRTCFIWLPFALALGGCLNAPAKPEERRTGVDLVGEWDSGTPLKIGQSTRGEVMALLGTPQQTSSDHRAIAYEYNPIVRRRGFICIGGPCGLCGIYPYTDRINETLWLAFDNQGKLARAISTRDGPLPSWQQFCESAPSTAPKPGGIGNGAP